jgi:prephenate dehydratase
MATQELEAKLHEMELRALAAESLLQQNQIALPEPDAAAVQQTQPSPQKFKVGYQGVPGAYSEGSCKEMLGNSAEPVGLPSFEDVFQAVESGAVDYALLPIENSLGGSIHANFDLMLRYNLHIVDEHTFRVRHSLMALPGTQKKDITRVMSHPQALAQCDEYIRREGFDRIVGYDTAGSAKLIADAGSDPDGEYAGVAAICSAHAAAIYGLEVLDEGIEDDTSNVTRFWLLAPQPVVSNRDGPFKTCVVFSPLEKDGGESGLLFKVRQQLQ